MNLLIYYVNYQSLNLTYVFLKDIIIIKWLSN